MCEIGTSVPYNLYSLFVLLLPRCVRVSSVPVPNADALDMDNVCVREHKRAWAGVRTCASGGTPMGGCVRAPS